MTGLSGIGYIGVAYHLIGMEKDERSTWPSQQGTWRECLLRAQENPVNNAIADILDRST